MTSFGDRMASMTLPQTLELDFKMKLAESKYKDRGKQMLKMYATDLEFQRLLLDHGENVIPIVAFFVENDLPSIRAQYELKSLPKKILSWWPWRNHAVNTAVDEDYSPHYRGLYAIDRANQEGHDFLGQFDIKDGKAKWNKTERAGEAVSEFLAGGIRNVERKRNQGAPITPMDWANAGSDVLVMFSATKFLKVPVTFSGPTQAASRIQKLGRSSFGGDSLVGKLFASGARVGTAYLIATNPSLLTGLFVDVGQWVGLPAWAAVLIGWFIVALGLSFLLMPLLAATAFLIPIIKLISIAARWLQPLPRILRQDHQVSKLPD
ncbi:MAG: hypothetical protein EON54_10665 [Alcaligenaceae bacterium]|nr:MAG: hypothetical protein EON54_10665 [Alcaligenaceae bacterium]